MNATFSKDIPPGNRWSLDHDNIFLSKDRYQIVPTDFNPTVKRTITGLTQKFITPGWDLSHALVGREDQDTGRDASVVGVYSHPSMDQLVFLSDFNDSPRFLNKEMRDLYKQDPLGFEDLYGPSYLEECFQDSLLTPSRIILRNNIVKATQVESHRIWRWSFQSSRDRALVQTGVGYVEIFTKPKNE